MGFSLYTFLFCSKISWPKKLKGKKDLLLSHSLRVQLITVGKVIHQGLKKNGHMSIRHRLKDPEFLFQYHLHSSGELRTQSLRESGLSWLRCRSRYLVHLPDLLGCASSSGGQTDKSIPDIYFADLMTANTFLKCHLALPREGGICPLTLGSFHLHGNPPQSLAPIDSYRPIHFLPFLMALHRLISGFQ